MRRSAARRGLATAGTGTARRRRRATRASEAGPRGRVLSALRPLAPGAHV